MRNRVAKLKPEHKHCYHGVSLAWHDAAWLAEVVLQRRRSEPPVWALQGRALPDEHFEFMGGRKQERLRGCRSRRLDSR
jgi:hypothetical protein